MNEGGRDRGRLVRTPSAVGTESLKATADGDGACSRAELRGSSVSLGGDEVKDEDEEDGDAEDDDGSASATTEVGVLPEPD